MFTFSLQAMFLVYRALAGETIPPVLPLQLIPLAKREKSSGLLQTAAPLAAPVPSTNLAPADSVFPSVSLLFEYCILFH